MTGEMSLSLAAPNTPVNWTAIGVVVTGAIGIGSLWVAVHTLRKTGRQDLVADSEWKGRVNQFMETVTKEITELRQLWFGFFGRPTITPGSPLTLTDFGKEISREAGAKDWVARVAGSLEVHDRDPYEIQTLCFQYAEDTGHYLDEELRVVRKIAYQRGLKTTEVRRVLAIELRDHLLELVGKEPPE